MNIAKIRAAIPGRRIDYYPSLDSTMRAAAQLETGAVVFADEQTAGQGRHGHTWHSEAGQGVYFSMALPPAPVLTLALGLAAAEAIAQTYGIACDLRWPNDLMLDGAKVGGILVQLVEGKAIAGIGINVNQTAFPPGLEATSLRLAGQAAACRPVRPPPELPREDLAIALIRAVDGFAAENQETILRLFPHASSYAAGRRVTVDLPDGRIQGTTAGLNPEGFLIVRKDDGTDTLILAGGVRAAGS
jgi:BirA family biotin operon repressor/biotin-[acetyl-CoA-carboxylase] ligase